MAARAPTAAEGFAAPHRPLRRPASARAENLGLAASGEAPGGARLV
jgi:hypothetical protein